MSRPGPKKIQPVEESHLPFVEWKKITFIALPTIAFLSIVQAFINQDSFEPWLAWIAVGMIFFSLLGVLLGVKYKIKLNFAPLTIFLLVSPILVGDRATKPWMSIGLVCMAAAIYFSVITNIYIAVSVSVAVALWQVIIASMDLSSVTDSRDILYFSAYFSTTWMLAIGIGSILIRRKYQEVTEKVDDIVAESLNETVNSLKKIQESNVTDSNNLRLHGTVLNTLIYLKNSVSTKMNPADIRQILLNDLQEVQPRNENFGYSDFRETILTSLEERTLKRISLDLPNSKIEIADRITARGVIEILREQILNLEKHTNVKAVEITFNSSISSGVHILTKSKAPEGTNQVTSAAIIENYRKSKSLAKITKSYSASHHISWNLDRNEIIQEIFVPYLGFQEELQASISQVRFTGLNDFAMNYVRIAIFSGFAALVGYIFSGIELNEWLLIAALTFGLFVATERPETNLPLIFTSIVSASIMSYIFASPRTCQDVLILPWLWNLLLVNGFLVALRVKNIFLQSTPLIILAIQSYIYPKSLPSSCQNILDGSLPAIPLIAILAMNVIRVRKREFDLDVQRVEESALQFSNYGDIDQAISDQYRSLVSNLENFATSQDFDLPPEELERIFEIQIQKIRAYLIAVEKYDSPLIREIYGFVRERLGNGHPTRLSLFGEFNSQQELALDIPQLLKELRNLLAERAVEIILSAGPKLEVTLVFAPAELPVQAELPDVDGVTFELLSH